MTENRMVTINRRETSLEGLVAQFENGEDGIYNLITNVSQEEEYNKNIYLNTLFNYIINNSVQILLNC